MSFLKTKTSKTFKANQGS